MSQAAASWWFSAIVLVVGLGACRVEPGGAAPGAPVTGAGGVGAGNGAGAPGAGSCSPVVSDTKFPMAACNNPADKCFFESNAALLYDLGGSCATHDCVQYVVQPDSPAAKQCFVDCFVQRLTEMKGSAVSRECASCSNAVVVCGAYHCLGECINDPRAPRCMACLCAPHDRTNEGGAVNQSCLIDAYAECAGFAPSADLVGCAGGGAGGTGGGTPGASGTAGTTGGAAGQVGTSAGTGGTSGGGAGAAGSGSDTDPTMGCDGATLLPAPADPSLRGPWPVGTRTVQFGRFAAVEVMYPAVPGSEAGKQMVRYDLRSWLPASERSKVPDAQATTVTANSFQDLPLDDGHGPYPVVILVHGTGAFRVASGETQSHWASHGFVVVAAEHPNLYLTDMLRAGCGDLGVPALDLNGDVNSEIQALTNPTGDLAFLAGHIDMSRIALAGHSAGAFNVAGFTTKPGVRVVIPLAGTAAVSGSSTLQSVLFVSGMADTVLSYAPPQLGIGGILYPGTTLDAYNGSAGPPAVKKRVVGITNGGHLAVTDLCQSNSQGQNPIEVSEANGVCGLGLLPSLFDCGTVERQVGTSIVNDATTAILEETLHCQDRRSAIAGLRSRHPQIGDFMEQL